MMVPTVHDDARGDGQGFSLFERETDYRYGRFAAWCKELAGRGVGLYGSGANARRILADDERPFEVRAVIDEDAVGSEVCGMQVVGLAEAPGLGIDVLVVAAELKSAAAVVRRIGPFCAENGIRAFDMYGNDLLELDAAVKETVSQTLSEQLRVIEGADALCINMNLLLDRRTARTIAECAHGDGRLDQCLGSVVDYARVRGKEVVFYSGDVSLARDEAAVLLRSEGLEGAGALLLSSEHALYVENGLFRKLYERVPAGKVVHIGPDLFKDCFAPLSYGARSVLAGNMVLPDYVWPKQGFDARTGAGAWYEDEASKPARPADERLRSCMAAVMPGLRERVGEQVATAVSVIGPLVVAYTTWLVARLEEAGEAYPTILFSARDGYLPKAVYDAFRVHRDDPSLPPSLYFHTSRKSSEAAAGNDDLCMAQRAGALRHYAADGLVPGKTYAFVEFVGAGTCQRQLEQFVPFGLHGFYFGSRVGDCLTRWIDSELYFDERDLSFLTRYLQLEPYLSSDEPSLEGFDEDGTPVFASEPRTAEELELLRDVQEHALWFAREYIERWYQPGDVVGHAFMNAAMPDLDACDADALSLYDDLNGARLSKRIGDFPAVSPGTMDAGEDIAGLASNRDIAKSDLLSILAAFDTVCSEFGLRYVATYGTMLGAMRDGGLIESDDDLDVAMPRADYDMLLSLAEEGAFPEPFFLQTPENDASYFSGGFAKLWRLPLKDDDEDADDPRSLEGCAWMDIMPLDNCPRDDAAVERRQRIIRWLQRTLYVQTYGLDLTKIWDARARYLSAYIIMAEHMSRPRLCELLKRACTSFARTGLLTVFAGNYRMQPNRIRFEAVAIEHAVRVPFEDTTIPVPANAEEWLEGHYGPGWNERPSSTGEGEE